MANKKNQQMVFEVTGDVSDLKKALGIGAESITSFGSKAGGVFSEFGEGLEKITNGFAGMSTGLIGAAAGAGVAVASIGVAFTKVSESAEKAFEIFEAASLSQMGLTQIERMSNLYAKVGLSMENIADQQKDIKDRIGDALTNLAGSMLTDVIRPLQLNVLELQKMADAGQDVYAKIYFAAKAQGYSTSQLVNSFETLGNDATKRLTLLREFNSEQDYNNALSSQQITLTDEQSKSFEAYRNATMQLSNAWNAWENSALAPVASRLAEILNLITSIINSKPVAAAAASTSQAGIDAVKQYNTGYIQQVVGNSSIYGQQMVNDQLKKQGEQDKNLKERISQAQALQQDIEKLNQQYNAGFQKSTIDAALKPFQTDKEAAQAKINLLESQYKQTKEAIQKSLVSAYGSDVKAQSAALDKLTKDFTAKRDDLVKKMNASDDAEAKKKQSQADAAAKKAAADAKALQAKQLQAQKSLNAIMGGTGESDAELKMNEFNRQQDTIVQKIQENAKILKLNADDTSKYLDAAFKTRTLKFKEMIDEMIGYTDPNAGLKKMAENLSTVSGSLTTQQATYLSQQQDQRVGLQGNGTDASNPWDNSNVLDQKRDDLQKQQDLELQMAQTLHNKLGTSEEEYQKRRAAIQAKYNEKTLAVATENTQQQMTMMSGAAGDLGTILSGAFGEGSKAAQAAFAVQKGISIANTIMSIQEALAKAMSLGFPASLPAYAQVLSLGASIISTAKGAASGKAHKGIDEVPGSGDQTWILKGGERVIQPEANKKLTSYLDNQESKSSSNSTSAPVVNAPLIIQGGSVDDDAKFQAMLKKHQNSVVQAVKSSQSRSQ